MKLRPYQREAADAAIAALKSSLEPIIIEAATGAGKSLIIAAISAEIHALTGKRILVIAPSAELVIQDRDKYLATGNPASTFSASAGAKSLRHPVVFGSPLTVKNRISAFKEGYALVVVDECDLITPTVKAIIDTMRIGNPNLRVLGLTATPYRMGSGYIYRTGRDGRSHGEDKARDPYFSRSVYEIWAKELIADGFLTPPVIGSINAESYDTSGLELNRTGKFDSAAVDRAYHGHGRKTAAIVGDIVRQAQGRNGVLIYAATKQHAAEVLASLPPSISAMITDDTPRAERVSILKRALAGAVKYIVNVAVLTVGVDLPNFDTIAVLRKTESQRLLQQIIGRGLRLFEGKTECLYLDYTTDNMETHFPDGDLFNPDVKARGVKEAGDGVTAECPDCGYENQFSAHKDAEGCKLDKHGYCIDVFDERIETDFGPMPGHHGRRCMGFVQIGKEVLRCSYRWTSKPCFACDEPNDISARYCHVCKAEIVSPEDKLIADFRATKKDPYQPQTDAVISWAQSESISGRGNRTHRVDFVTPWRNFSVWLLPEANFSSAQRDWARFQSATNEGGLMPSSVSYLKDKESGFFRILAYNQPIDALEAA